MTPELKTAFQFHLRTLARNRQGNKATHWLKLQRDLDMREGGSAFRALNAARRDVESGTRRYPSGYRSGNGVTYQPGQPGIAYVEKPESVGLRLVGEVSIEFRRGPFNRNSAEGWLTDPYGDVFKDGTGLCYGEVYQLPGKNGESRFVAGYRFGGCDGGPTLDLTTVYSEPRGDWYNSISDCDAARDAASAADSMAQSAAESEREYQTAWQAGSQWASEAETVATSRAKLKALLQERRKARIGAELDSGYAAEFSSICKMIKRQVSDLLRDVRKARERMAELAAGDAPDLYFYDGEERLQSAFCEGAGLESFPS